MKISVNDVIVFQSYDPTNINDNQQILEKIPRKVHFINYLVYC
jgi:hypothetical protein